MRRCVVSLLASLLSRPDSRVSESARHLFIEIISNGKVDGAETGLIYVNHIEDLITTSTREHRHSFQSLVALGGATEREGFLSALLAHGPEILESVAGMKTLIRSYSRTLADYLSCTSSVDCDFPQVSSQDLANFLSGSEEAQFYLLKCLRGIGGNDLLLSYLHRPSRQPFFPRDVRLISETRKASLKSSFLNPFPHLLGNDCYLAGCEAYKELISPSSDGRKLKTWLKSQRKLNLSSLVAAIQTEMDLGDNLNQLSDYVNSCAPSYSLTYYGQVNETDLVAHVMNWTMQLERSGNRTKYEHNLFQLLSHVGIIAVQHTQSLPAAAIHDPSVLSRFFLPGMPQNEMSLLAQAMGYVGWYQCRNGHPYTVGEVTHQFISLSHILVHLPYGGISLLRAGLWRSYWRKESYISDWNC